jgi:hypothetical protein
MGKLNLDLDDKIDKKFRDAVAKKKGMKKGNLTDAVEEAMLMWMSAPARDEKD